MTAPVIPKINLDIKADLTGPLDKFAKTICGALDIPLAIINRAGKTSSKSADILDAWLESKKKKITIHAQSEQSKVLNLLNQKQEKNILGIINEARTYLPNQPISSEEVNEDWLNNFFENSKLISSELMRTIWARILTNEVVKPGSFSIQSQNILKLMSSKDAKDFTQYANLIWLDITCILLNQYELQNYGISYDEILNLKALGLADIVDSRVISYTPPKKEVLLQLFYQNKTVLLKVKNESTMKGLIPNSCGLTKAGKEIFKLIENFSFNEDYFKKCIEVLSNDFDIDIRDN